MHISRPNSKSSSRSLHTNTTEISLEGIRIIVERVHRFHDAIQARGGLAFSPNSSQVEVLVSIRLMHQLDSCEETKTEYNTKALEQATITSERLGAAVSA